MARENLWLVKCTDRDGDDVDGQICGECLPSAQQRSQREAEIDSKKRVRFVCHKWFNMDMRRMV